MKIFNKYFWSDLWYKQVSSRLNPRQKWLTKTIPRTYCDKVELIPQLLFTCLVNYVEVEEGLSHLDTDWTEELKGGFISQEYVDNVVGTERLLKEVYDYIKVERPKLQLAHDNSYPELITKNGCMLDDPNEYGVRYFSSCEMLYGMSYEKAYAETNRLEKLIEERDQWAMKTIVEKVNYLWT